MLQRGHGPGVAGAGAEQLGQQFVCVNIRALAPGESSFPMTLVSLVLHLIFVWG